MNPETAKQLGRDFYGTPATRAIPNNDTALIAGMALVDGYNRRVKLYKAWLAGWNEANSEMVDSIEVIA